MAAAYNVWRFAVLDVRAYATLLGMLSCFVSGPDLVVGGSPRIYAGEGALQRSGRSFRSDTRFSAGGSEKVLSTEMMCYLLQSWSQSSKVPDGRLVLARAN